MDSFILSHLKNLETGECIVVRQPQDTGMHYHIAVDLTEAITVVQSRKATLHVMAAREAQDSDLCVAYTNWQASQGQCYAVADLLG